MVSLSASSTPSCSDDKSIDAEFPFSISNVRFVPFREGVNKFWSSELPNVLRSVVMVPPASVISKSVPFKTTVVFSSLVESASASFIWSLITLSAVLE